MQKLCTCAKCQVRQAPLLSVERFRELMICETNPWHFWQLANGRIKSDRQCLAIVRENRWQGGKFAGRKNIAEAIRSAEGILRKHLGFPVGPTWLCSDVELRGNYWQSDAIQLPFRYVQAVGREVLHLLGDYEISFHDDDGDGLPERFTLTIPYSHSARDGDDLQVYFRPDDLPRPLPAMDERQVRPVEINHGPNGYVLTGRTWTIVRPRLYGGVAAPENPGLKDTFALDPERLENFAGSLSVYRRAFDRAESGSGIWRSGDLCSCSASCDIAQRMDFCVEDGPGGLVRPLRLHDCSTPTRVNISYLAGACLEDWELTIARLATAELRCHVCECSESCLTHWQKDLSVEYQGGKQEIQQYNASARTPLGSLRGHFFAWDQIQEANSVAQIMF